MTQGKFSIVVALFEVEEYVQSFLESLKNQTYPFKDLDIVIVDDGSPDESMNIVDEWVRKYPDVIRAIRKSNGGPGSARNAGLELARNEWVTFPDPDDTLHPGYFSEVIKVLAKDKSERIEMVTTRLVQHVDGTIKTNHGHPLDWKFRSGNRLIDLNSNPDFVQLSGGTVFVRLSVVKKANLRFDERIRPKFEDANFIGRYLALVPNPVVAVVASARYFYRKRSDGSSLIQSSWSNPGVYNIVPDLGYLGLLKAVKEIRGYVPRWTQAMIIYELVWAYAEQKNMHSVTGAASDEQKLTFLSYFDEILSYFDKATILEFGTISQGWIFHNILLSGVGDKNIEPPTVIRWAIDSQRELIKYSYVFQGDMPHERIEINGSVVKPIAEKVIAYDFFGRTGLFERAIVVPYGELRVHLDGQLTNITSTTPLPKRGRVYPLGLPRTNAENIAAKDSPNSVEVEPTEPLESSRKQDTKSTRSALRKLSLYRKIDDKVSIQALLLHKSKRMAAIDAVSRIGLRLAKKSMNSIANSKHASDINYAGSEAAAIRFKNAWILIDRKDRGDDNAEHLYRYLARSRPDINAWFVVQRDSSDWNRLSKDGFRLLPYGSHEAAIALRYASFNISSHADRDIQYPPHHRRFGASKAKIVFLQHGVTKDDLSRWLNQKKIELMITATKDEYLSIAGDNTNYKLTSNEVMSTGFPRHDELRRLTIAAAESERRNILIAPTWRQYLTSVFDSGLAIDEISAEFEHSDFGRNWLMLLNDAKLARIASEKKLRIKFLAHPNFASIVPYLNLPDYIDVLDFSAIRVQEELVSAAILVSDFSSLAFEGAYAGANIVHFQFDGDEIFRGGHVYRKGYFNYETDGFGPRVTTVNALVEHIERMVIENFVRPKKYEEHITSAFEFWDQGSCGRVAAAIENLNRPWWTSKP